MKKFLMALAVTILITSTTSYAARSEISFLDAGEGTDELSVMTALLRRQTDRDFVDKDLTTVQLAKILWAANGNNRPNGKRVNPAAMGVYSVEVYAVTREGIYLYEPENHKLKLVAEGDYRLIAANGKETPARAAVNLIYVETPAVWSSLNKTPARDKQIFYADVMVGAMVQSVALVVETEGLGNCVRGGVLRDEFKKVAKLSDEKNILLAQSVGFVK